MVKNKLGNRWTTHRICKAVSVTLLLFIGALHLVEHIWSWGAALIWLAVAYTCEAVFEALRPGDYPSTLII